MPRPSATTWTACTARPAPASTQAQYWSDTMGGFKGQKDDAGEPIPSLYDSCAADGENAVIKLTAVTSKFPAILGLPSFSIQSPTALEKYDANNVTAEGDSFVYPAYGTEHPTGTGPFIFGKYDQANNVVELDRNADYWGTKASTGQADLQDHPGRDRPQAGTAGRHDRRLRPAEPGRLGPAEVRRLQRRGPSGVQHPVHGHQPEEQPEAAGSQGPPGHRLRAEP